MKNNSQNQITRRDFEAELIAKAWKDEVFKQELLSNSKTVYIQALKQQIAEPPEFLEQLKIQILEEDSNTLYLVIPKAPKVSEELSEEALETVAGGGTFVVEHNGTQVVIGW
jgi:hypothetical protein